MNIKRRVKSFMTGRLLWLALFLVNFMVLMIAIGLQYFANWKPCSFCVFERLLVIGIAGISLLVFVFYSVRVKLVGNALAIVLSGYSKTVANQHLLVESGEGFLQTCRNFKPIETLEGLMPFIFKPTGRCDATYYIYSNITIVQGFNFFLSVIIFFLCITYVVNLLDSKK